MFSLDRSKATITAVTPRMEHHGDELVPAVSIRLDIPATNDVLTEFDPWLKGALYKRPDGGQGELIPDASHMPILRFPLMGEFEWAYQGAGYMVTLHNEFIDDIEIEDVSFNGVKIECKADGHVGLSINVNAKPTGSVIGALCQLLQHDINLTLTAPSLDDRVPGKAPPQGELSMATH